MKVVLLRDPSQPEAELLAIKKHLSGSYESVLSFETRDLPEIQFKQDRPSFRMILATLEKQRGNMPDVNATDFLVYLSPKPNSDNWFSAASYSSGKVRNIYVQTSEWDYFVPCSPEVAVAYQVIENILDLCVFGSLGEAEEGAHEPPIGCTSDMCAWKVDVSLKMRTADICSNCAQKAESILGREVVGQLLCVLEKLRGDALITSRTLPGGVAAREGEFYPIAITKRRMKNEQEPLRRFFKLLDYFDALIRCAAYILSARQPNHPENNSLTTDNRSHKTLGWWFYRFRDLLGAELDQQSAAQVLHMIEQDPQVKQVIAVRNQFRGHGYCNQGDQTYAEVFNTNWPIVQKFEASVLPLLAPYRFLSVQSTRQLPDGQAEYRLLQLHGDHPDFLVETMRCGYNPVLYDEGVFAHESATGRWINMAPLIQVRECSACRHSRLLLWDGDHYLDPDCGQFAVSDH